MAALPTGALEGAVGSTLPEDSQDALRHRIGERSSPLQHQQQS